MKFNSVATISLIAGVSSVAASKVVRNQYGYYCPSASTVTTTATETCTETIILTVTQTYISQYTYPPVYSYTPASSNVYSSSYVYSSPPPYETYTSATPTTYYQTDTTTTTDCSTISPPPIPPYYNTTSKPYYYNTSKTYSVPPVYYNTSKTYSVPPVYYTTTTAESYSVPPVYYTSTTTSSSYSAAQTHHVVVGGPGLLAYTPNNIKAAVGDVIEFEFLQKNHTVTQSDFLTPCVAHDGGFKTGFVPNLDNTMPGPIKSLTVMDDKPFWAYCGQKLPIPHCEQGMVFAINAPEYGNTFDKFVENAKNTVPPSA